MCIRLVLEPEWFYEAGDLWSRQEPAFVFLLRLLFAFLLGGVLVTVYTFLMDLPWTVRRQRPHAYLCRAMARRYWPTPATVLRLWLGLLVLVVIGELIPGDSTPMLLLSNTDVSDKLVHFTAYTVLALVPALGLRLRVAILCLVATELVGISLEFTQFLIPYRSWDIYDVAANTAGVVAGAALGIRVRMTLAPVFSV